MRRTPLILVLACLVLAPATIMSASEDRDATEGAAPAEYHGSVAFSWYRYDDTSGSGFDFDRPVTRLNLKARRLFGGHYDLRVRFRSRYDERARVVGGREANEWRNRVYELCLTYDNPGSPLGFEVGRIISRDMGGVGYVDGVMINHRIGEEWRWGVLAGTRPDWKTSDFQTDITKYGAFVSFGRGDRAESRVEASLAAVGEYHGSTVSREYLYLRTDYHRERKLDVYGTAELDLNRDWREQRTGETVSLTALYLRWRYRVSDRLAVGLGYDTRKNYLTYEARSIPDSLFIDAARRGARATLDIKMPADVDLHGELGLRDIASPQVDPTYYLSAQFTRRDLLVKRLTGSARLSSFSGPDALGTNVTLRLSKAFHGGHSIYLTSGTYYYRYGYAPLESGADRFNQWVGVGGLAQLPADFYFSGELSQDWGDDSEGHRLLGEVGYRF
jgi:hypothetical protein